MRTYTALQQVTRHFLHISQHRSVSFLHLILFLLVFEKIAGVDDTIEDKDGGIFVKDEDGHLTGQLFEAPAIMRVLGAAPKPTPEELEDTLRKQWIDYSACGFTTVTDMAYIPNQEFDHLLEQISLEDTCPVRLALYRVVLPDKATDASRKRTVCCPRLFINDERDTVGF